MAYYTVSCDDLSTSLLIEPEVLNLVCTHTILSNFEKELSIISQHADLMQETAFPQTDMNDTPSETRSIQGEGGFAPTSKSGVNANESQAHGGAESIAILRQEGNGIVLTEPILAFNEGSADDASPTIVSASTPASIRPLLEREASQGEQDALAAVDAAMLVIVTNDSKVTQMSSELKCSRDECLFYLESTNYDLEKAIAIYKGFSMD